MVVLETNSWQNFESVGLRPIWNTLMEKVSRPWSQSYCLQLLLKWLCLQFFWNCFSLSVFMPVSQYKRIQIIRRMNSWSQKLIIKTENAVGSFKCGKCHLWTQVWKINFCINLCYFLWFFIMIFFVFQHKELINHNFYVHTLWKFAHWEHWIK